MKQTVTIIAGLAALAVVVGAQQPTSSQPPPFRTGVDALQLDVSVLDKDRRPVRGLTAADFTVLENGKPARIVGFSAVELPVSAPTAAPAPTAPIDTIIPDVVGNELADVGRIAVILMDYQLRESAASVLAQRSAARLVDGLGPGDLGAVVHVMFGRPQNLTSDRERLKAALATSVAATIRPERPDESPECLCGVCKIEAVTQIANALRGEPQRRKTVFFVGEQFPGYPRGDSCDVYLGPATRQMLHATHVANVAVHAIDPNGLEVTSVQASDNFRNDPNRSDSVSAAARQKEQTNRSSLIERQQSLRALADLTGGRTVMNTNAPEEAVRTILDESAAYYLLGVQVALPKPDGRFHPITVKVNRPDVQVRTRKGYYAETVTRANSPTETTSLEAISRGLLPERSLPMSVTAAPFRGPRGTPILVVATGVRASQTAAAGAQGTSDSGKPPFERVEILTTAFRDSDKSVEWQRQQLSLAAPEKAPGQLRYEAISTLAVKPGAYELRAAARQGQAHDAGSVHTYVDVPDFDSARVTLSGAVLFDPGAPTATPLEALAGVLDTSPTTRREFTAGDQITALVRVYQRAREQPSPVKVFFHVFDKALRKVGATETMIESAEFAGRGAADARFLLPLEALQPGPYVLRIGIPDGGSALRRDVRFTVK